MILAIPRKEGHIVVDVAMAQFSYGKIEECKFKKQQLPVPGGYDSKGNLTTDPAEIEKTWRVLPIGFWKGSGLSIALDLIAAVVSGGKSTHEVGKLGGDEYALSQIMIAIDPYRFSSPEFVEKTLNDTIEYIKASIPMSENGKIYYPGEIELMTRVDNLKNGIPVEVEIWEKIKSM